MKTMPASLEFTELELVALARCGDQAAYGQLVSRHQTLVVSLAYSICGDFARSQDIAQDAFVAAWRQLDDLHDATKFKGWLCGITRNLGNSFVRKQSRHTEQSPAAPDTAPETVADTPGPHEHAITREESAIVWRALEQLPQTYREPLILFYREHQSIERVASALDLSEDTVKQRLSRGRGMLRDQVENLIERSLGHTTPGVMFTAAVLGALPVLAAQFGAGAMAGAAVKGGAATKAASTLPWLAILASPLLAIPTINIVASIFFGHRLLRSCRSPEIRSLIKRLWWIEGIVSNLALIALVGMGWWQFRNETPSFSIGTFALISLGLLAITVIAPVLIGLRHQRPLLDYARNFQPPENASHWRKKLTLIPRRALIYRSKVTAFGLPLLDIRFGHSTDEPLVRGTAVGWIAMGDIAHGVVFALGGYAVGGVAVGGIAIGAFSVGYLATGLVVVGGVAIGGLAKGILLSVGWLALGTVAVGWEAASGILAIAKHIASGGIAFAESTAYAATHGWEETNAIVSTFKPPEILAAILLAILNAVIAVVATNARVRSGRDRTPGKNLPPRESKVSFPKPRFLGLLAAFVVVLALVFQAAIARTSRRLTIDREASAHAKDRYEQGREFAHAGKPAEALAEFLWCLDDAGRRGRTLDNLSPVYSRIEELSRNYAPAKSLLRERRDRAEAAVLNGHYDTMGILDVWEVVVLNRFLDETQRSRALYERLPPHHRLRPSLARQLSLPP